MAPPPREPDGSLPLPLPIVVVAAAVLVREIEPGLTLLVVPLLLLAATDVMLLVVTDVMELDVVQVDSRLVASEAVIWPEARVEPYGVQPTPADMVTPNIPESQHHEPLRAPLLSQSDQFESGHYMRNRVSNFPPVYSSPITTGKLAGGR
jgi:hypothetical protein